ncbi:sulfatase [Paenibacillus sp. IB182496]|uniref:Sulfatase n=1 Tax=Paenibacillus sabuli TaxID=2772509 RepID=A0A927BYT4_9BACL|nr:sulfatase [Paenibacillus sabuli]MBD2848095.1 sulfatase [Paenibacillus sabuli]
MRIIYFDLDCVRPDHLGTYGYERGTSPHIDEIAKQSFVFDQCFASDTPCVPSRAALFSCRPGISNGVVSHESPGCHFRFPGQEGMPNYYDAYTMPMRLLQQHNVHTTTFSIFAQRHMSWWFNAGFSEVHNPTQPNIHEHAATVNPRVTQWIKQNIHDHPDLFMHVHYWDAHTPYHPDAKLRDRIARQPARAHPDQALIEAHYEHVYGPKTARDLMIRQPGYRSPSQHMPDEISNREQFVHMLDSYDASIATVDQAVGEVVALLKEEGVYEDTAIIISGDHGEAISELGMYFEHGIAVDGVARVPLIIRWPGLTDRQRRSSALVYHYDWMATMMELLGIASPAQWDARSFAAALQSGADIEGRPYVVYGEGLFTLQRAVRTPDHAYIKTFHSGCYPLDDCYLFDIRKDPQQQCDIKRHAPTVVAEMERLYAQWWNRWCTGPDAVRDPMLDQIPSFEYFPVALMKKRLEAVDRQDQWEDLQQRLSTRRSGKGPIYDSKF